MYLAGAVILAFLFMFDEQIHKYFGYGKIGKALSNIHSDAYVATMHKLKILEETRESLDDATYQARKKALLQRLKEHAGSM